jgi:rhamnosyltransferase
MSQPPITVVIPTLNAGPGFAACLERVLAQKSDLPFDVVIVDSGSTDETLAIAARFPLRLQRIPRATFNHGLTRNAGLALAGGRVGVLLVQDAWPANDQWLAALVTPLLSDDRLAAAYSRQLPRPDAPTLVRYELQTALAGQEQPRLHTADASLTQQSPLEQRAVVNLDNVSSALSLDVWRRFPFAAVPFGEDLEWARRVLLAGYSIAYVPQSLVIHSHDRGWGHYAQRNYIDVVAIHRIFSASARLSPWTAARLTVRSARGLLRQWRGDAGRQTRTLFSLGVATFLRGLAYQAAVIRLLTPDREPPCAS